MKLTFEYTKNYCKQMLRNPSALFFTLFFPALLLSMFGGEASTRNATDQLITYIIYCNFAVQTVMLQALGISISADRASDWSVYLKTLPVTLLPSALGRVLSSLLFSVISLAIVILMNVVLHPLKITLSQHVIIIVCALLGGIPMAFLALLLARFLNPVAARGGFVLINTLLLFASYSVATSGMLAMILNFIPTHQWLALTISALNFNEEWFLHGMCLIGYALLFYFLMKQSERIFAS